MFNFHNLFTSKLSDKIAVKQHITPYMLSHLTDKSRPKRTALADSCEMMIKRLHRMIGERD